MIKKVNFFLGLALLCMNTTSNHAHIKEIFNGTNHPVIISFLQKTFHTLNTQTGSLEVPMLHDTKKCSVSSSGTCSFKTSLTFIPEDTLPDESITNYARLTTFLKNGCLEVITTSGTFLIITTPTQARIFKVATYYLNVPATIEFINDFYISSTFDCMLAIDMHGDVSLLSLYNEDTEANDFAEDFLDNNNNN